MKTFKHKSSAVLATLTEKTVWMSNLEGNIYKQFPLQHFKPEQFLDELIPFPGNFDEAKAKFIMANDEKKQKKAQEEEARRIREYEERKGKVLHQWALRKAVYAGKEIFFTVVNRYAYTNENDWESEYVGREEDSYFYDNKEDYEEELSRLRTLKPDYGCYLEIVYGSYHPTIEEWDEEETEDHFDDMLYDMGKTEIIKYPYASLEGCILVAWSWETHIGYAQKLHRVFYADYDSDFNTERDLITGNEERLWRPCVSILLTKEEVESKYWDGFSYEPTLEEKVADRLNHGYKWLHFAKFSAEDIKNDSRIEL